MIAIFKKNDLVNFVLLLPYAIVLRLNSLVHPVQYTVKAGDSFITTWLFESVFAAPILQAILGILLVYIHAVLINTMANAHRLHRIPSALSGMSYILLVSCIEELQVLSPALIGMTFVILATYSIFNTYKNSIANSAIFNAALSGALATLIYPPYLILVLAFMVGLGMMRSFNWKEKFQFIFGFSVVFWIVGSFLYSMDWLDWPFLDQVGISDSYRDLVAVKGGRLYILIGAIFLISVTLFNYYNYKKKKGIDIRKKIDYFYWLILSSFFVLFLFRNMELTYLIFLSLPLAIFIGMTWNNIKSSLISELIHVLILVGIFYNHFWI